MELEQRPSSALSDLLGDLLPLVEHDVAQRTQLDLPEDLPFDRWMALGEFFAAVRDSLKWWAGDWLIFGEAAYGEMAAQALHSLGVEGAVQEQWRYVCMYVPRSRRRRNLSFSHHREVAPLPPQDQKRLLARAEKDGLTAKELREVKRQEASGDEPEPEQPQWTKGDVVEDLRSAARMVSQHAQAAGDGSYVVPAEPIARLRSALGEPEADG